MTNQDKTFRQLSKYEAKSPNWFWEPYIPYGMITILEGDPGLGKTFVALYLASRLSAGGTLPSDHKLAKQGVAYLSYEDDPNYTLRPRGDNMGGDPKRIHVLDSDFVLDSEGFKKLEKLIEDKSIGLVVIDPFVAAISSKTDMYRSNSIREVLNELKVIAAAHDCAIILVRHLTKTQHEKAIYQGGGSMDYIGAARSALRVSVHPEDADKRVMVHIKHNIGPPGVSWAFRLQDKGKGKIPELVWEGECSIRAEDLVNSSARKTSPIECAREFLMRELSNKPRPADIIKEIAQQEGIADRTLTRARDDLGIKPYQKRRKWYWPRFEGSSGNP